MKENNRKQKSTDSAGIVVTAGTSRMNEPRIMQTVLFVRGNSPAGLTISKLVSYRCPNKSTVIVSSISKGRGNRLCVTGLNERSRLN